MDNRVCSRGISDMNRVYSDVSVVITSSGWYKMYLILIVLVRNAYIVYSNSHSLLCDRVLKG